MKADTFQNKLDELDPKTPFYETDIVIGFEMSPEELEITKVILRDGKIFLLSTKKKNYTMDAWNHGHSVGRSAGFIAGKWAGYTQALRTIIDMIPGGSLKESIQKLFDEAISSGKTP